MKNTKTRKLKAPEETMTIMRLVNMETPHGTFLRFAWVTCYADGKACSIETLPVVFNEQNEASSIAQQMIAAVQLPVLEINRQFQSVH
jgi:hypothetical protein